MKADMVARAPGPGLRTVSAAAAPIWGPGKCRLSWLLPGAGGWAGSEPATAGCCGRRCSGHWPALPGP
ncbi:hypothetical protein HaLaN_24413 [Haematococcus lacustris]|uniref:Uncharacterized protein n=1 Tax=Haematococcus lacustris TaxID=44745 RepID=A0A6A0A2F4_HAELA|nr:hypothetical protein HaLaN_24413 [Haematococcus lacustris]